MALGQAVGGCIQTKNGHQHLAFDNARRIEDERNGGQHAEQRQHDPAFELIAGQRHFTAGALVRQIHQQIHSTRQGGFQAVVFLAMHQLAGVIQSRLAVGHKSMSLRVVHALRCCKSNLLQRVHGLGCRQHLRQRAQLVRAVTGGLHQVRH